MNIFAADPISVDEAIVLVGGLGTRLRSVVADVPKPLAPVAGRPFLLWLLDALAAGGIRHVVLACGYRGHMIEDVVRAAHTGMAVEYAHEPAPLGTGGAIWQAMRAVRGDRAFVLNGDTFLALDFTAMAALDDGADVVIAVRPVSDRARYGAVRVEGGHVREFGEKSLAGPGLVNCGTYIARRDLAARFAAAGAFSFERAILQERLSEIDLRAFEVPGDAFIDIGTPEDYERAQTLVPAWISGAPTSGSETSCVSTRRG